MKVFRGRLVHSIGAHQDIEVLEDRLVGLDVCGKVLKFTFDVQLSC
jgi:hypothetical protein